jgi:cysteine synthase
MRQGGSGGNYEAALNPLWGSPEAALAERKTILRTFGAEVVVVASEAEAIAKARELARTLRHFLTDQSANDSSWRAHYETTGVEI